MKSPWNKGKKLTADHKTKISETLTGREPWNKGKVGLMPIPWNKGKTIPDQTKDKISNTLKGRVPWNKGKEWSDEMKEKFSELAKQRYEKDRS